MNRKLGKALVIGLSSAFILMAAGCSGKEKEDTAATNEKEYVYTAEYQQLPDNNYMQGLCSKGNNLYFVSNTYNEETEESKTALNVYDVTTKEQKELPLGLDNQNTNVMNMGINSEGNLVILFNSYIVEGEDYENAKSTFGMSVISSTDGSVLLQEDITELLQTKDDNAYVQYMTIDKDDNVYMALGEGEFVVLNKEGKLAFKVPSSNNGWVQGLGTTKEGQAVFLDMGQGSGGAQINIFDPAAKNVSKTINKNVPNLYGNGMVIPGINTGILISGESDLIEYDLEKETSSSILNWLDCDINRDNIRFFAPLEDGRIVVLTQDYSSEMSTTELILLTKTKASEVKQKEIITLGVLYSSSEVNKGIISFNKSNEKYRIEVKNYGENVEDYQAALTTFNNDIISGNNVDIFDLSSVNMKQLANKGLIEDLAPYLEKDPDVKRADLFESVLQAYTMDGILLGIPNSFSIQTLIAKASDVGAESGWTLSELMDFVSQKPEGVEIFEYGTKDQVLYTCMANNFDSYVNWSTGECNFNSEDFKNVLEFANTFPQEANYNEDDLSQPEKIQQGKLLFMNGYISNVEDYSMFDTIFQEPITAIGYPSNTGNGAFLQGSYSFAINAKSKNKDAAWEFIKSFLVPEFYENNRVWSMPTLISAFDKSNEEYTRAEYTTDENGNQVEVSKGSMGWNNFTIERYAATDKQVEDLTKLINETKVTMSYDTQLMSIVSEEVAPFFKGQKTAEEVMEIIQSRVQIYVNENR